MIESDPESLLVIVEALLQSLRERHEEFLTEVEQRRNKWFLDKQAKIRRIRRRKQAKQAEKYLEAVMRKLRKGAWQQLSTEELRMSSVAAVDPLNDQLTGYIEVLHLFLGKLVAAANQLPTEERHMYLDTAAIYTRQIDDIYYTQQGNLNILSRAGAKAWTRTCNITSLAMVLNSIGIGKTHYKMHVLDENAQAKEREKQRQDPRNYHFYSEQVHRRLLHLYCELNKIENPTEQVWKDKVSKLAMPDFLQYAAIDIVIGEKLKGRAVDEIPKQKFRKLLFASKKEAANRITSTVEIFDDLSFSFGARKFRVLEGKKFDRIASIGTHTAAVDKELDQQLIPIIVNLVEHVWESFMIRSPIPGSLLTLLREFGVRSGAGIGRKAWRETWQNWGDRFEEKFGAKFIYSEQKYRPPEWYASDEAILSIGEALVRVVDARQEGYELLFSLFPRTEELMKDLAQELPWNGDDAPVRNGVKLLDFSPVFQDVVKLFYVDYPPPKVLEEFNRSEVEANSVRMDLEGHVQLAGDLRKLFLLWEKHGEMVSAYQKSAGWKDFKKTVLSTFEPLLNNGAGVVVLRKGHYVKLKDVTEDFVCFSDPASGIRSDGSVGRDSCMPWQKANKLGFFRAFHVYYHPYSESRFQEGLKINGMTNGKSSSQ